MRSISPHTMWLTIVSFALISCPSVHAQCTTGGIGFDDVGIVSGNPFSAEIAISSSGDPQALHWKRKIARDSEGRIRVESIARIHGTYGPAESATTVVQRLIDVCEPVAKTLTTIDVLKGTANILHTPRISPSTHPLPSFCSTQLFRMPIGFSAGQDLGFQIIAGVQAPGERVNTPLHPEDAYENSGPIRSIRETWCSDELSAIVLRVTENISTPGKSESAMQNINRSEPDPALFQIPRGYSVTERGATGASPNSK